MTRILDRQRRRLQYKGKGRGDGDRGDSILSREGEALDCDQLGEEERGRRRLYDSPCPFKKEYKERKKERKGGTGFLKS